MACPQRENGFTGIANEILVAVAARKFTGTQQAVLMLLWRETYGWSRIEARFSLGLIERAIGIEKTFASRILTKLQELNVIEMTAPANGSLGAAYRFQKNYEQWAVEVRGGCVGTPPPRVVLGHNGGGGVGTQRGGWTTAQRGGWTTAQPIKEKVKENQLRMCARVHEEPTLDAENELTLDARAVRLLVQLQPSGLTTADRTALGELLRNTADKSPTRVIECLTDAVGQTQAHRRDNQTRAPARFALAIAGRLLSEPEPGPPPEYVRAPPGWSLFPAHKNGPHCHEDATGIDSRQEDDTLPGKDAKNDSRGNSVRKKPIGPKNPETEGK